MSPFLAAAVDRSCDVVYFEEEKCTVATATATRVVEDLETIDTIFASPEEVRWVNRLNGESWSCPEITERVVWKLRLLCWGHDGMAMLCFIILNARRETEGFSIDVR